MTIIEIKSIIEALLFTWGEPLSLSEIGKILEIGNKDLERIMSQLIDDFNYNKRGLRIIKIDDMYQIGTRPEHHEYIKRLNYSTTKRNLSNAALETLSIIAYKQPVIKSEIDHIRGVKCDRAIETLISRQMIKELGRLDRPGKPIIYGTTEEFLRSFGLESLDDLPDLKKIEEKLQSIEE